MTSTARSTTLTAKIGEVAESVRVELVSTGVDYLTVRVASREDALLACYCYRSMRFTKIERATDGGWLVVAYKTHPNEAR